MATVAGAPTVPPGSWMVHSFWLTLVGLAASSFSRLPLSSCPRPSPSQQLAAQSPSIDSVFRPGWKGAEPPGTRAPLPPHRQLPATRNAGKTSLSYLRAAPAPPSRRATSLTRSSAPSTPYMARAGRSQKAPASYPQESQQIPDRGRNRSA